MHLIIIDNSLHFCQIIYKCTAEFFITFGTTKRAALKLDHKIIVSNEAIILFKEKAVKKPLQVSCLEKSSESVSVWKVFIKFSLKGKAL